MDCGILSDNPIKRMNVMTFEQLCNQSPARGVEE